MKALFNFLLLTVLPGAAFGAGYSLTERFFRWKLIAYPFEATGIAVGLGFFFWTLSLLGLMLEKPHKKGAY